MPSFFPESVENIIRMYARAQEFTIIYEEKEVVVQASMEDLMNDFKRRIIAVIPELSGTGLHCMWFTEVNPISWGGVGWNHLRRVSEYGISPYRPMVLNIDTWVGPAPSSRVYEQM